MATIDSNPGKSRNKEGSGEKKPYERPAIIFEGIITTRAGSPFDPLTGGGDDNAVDPADLFGNGN
jgi:hypothetical protein